MLTEVLRRCLRGNREGRGCYPPAASHASIHAIAEKGSSRKPSFRCIEFLEMIEDKGFSATALGVGEIGNAVLGFV